MLKYRLQCSWHIFQVCAHRGLRLRTDIHCTADPVHISESIFSNSYLIENIEAIWKRNFTSCLERNDKLLNDTPNSSPSPLAEMEMSWVCQFSNVTP